MPKRSPDFEKGPAERRVARALESGLAEVENPREAAETLNALESAAGNLREDQAGTANAAESPQQQARALESAGKVSAAAKPASVIEAVAVQSAQASPDAKPIIDDAVEETTGGQAAPMSAQTARGRTLLRRELFRRLRPLQAIDAIAYVQINQLPHPPRADRFMERLSFVMTGGAGWMLVLVLAIIRDRRSGWNATRAVAPALWLATTTVEFPIKKSFRRRRPFISLVHAIIVGRKPGSYSFPSGHSAAAFAGALLLSRVFPRGKRGFFALASLVGFSRVYLGVHYPGDVLSGSLAGMLLARVYSRLLRKIGIAPE